MTKGRNSRSTVLLVAIALILSACSPASPAPPTPQPSDAPSASSGAPTAEQPSVRTGTGSVQQAYRSVKLKKATATVSISPADLDDVAAARLTDLVRSGVMASAPIEVSAAKGAARAGVTLTRTYAAPLPSDASATFAFFDADLRGWRPVSSKLAADRRTLTAKVDHLSMWTDLISGPAAVVDQTRRVLTDAGATVMDTGALTITTAAQWNTAVARAFTSISETLYWGVGKVFDVRVDAPTCQGKPPSWLDEGIFIADDRNNPIRWCTGHDPKRPELLVVKARVNRGFAYFVRTSVVPEWTYQSAYDREAVEGAFETVAELDAEVGASIAELSGGGEMVPAGEEIDFGFTREQLADAPDGPLVELELPNPGAFVSSVIARQLVAAGIDYDTSIVSSVIAAAACLDKLRKVNDPASLGAAGLTCVQSNDERLARLLSRALMKTGKSPQAAGKLAGSVMAKVSVYTALVAPVFNILNWAVESTTDRSIRSFTAFLRWDDTLITKINPLTSSGRLKSGWGVDDQSGSDPVDCSYDEGSPAGVTPGTHRCGGTADSTYACWSSTQYPGRLLCSVFPWKRKLVMRSAVNVPSVTNGGPRAVPLGLETADGSQWTLRVGGSWGGRADNLYGAYHCVTGPSCGTGKDLSLLSDGNDPIDRSGPLWTVRRGELGDPRVSYPAPKVLKVHRAWFITTR